MVEELDSVKNIVFVLLPVVAAYFSFKSGIETGANALFDYLYENGSPTDVEGRKAVYLSMDEMGQAIDIPLKDEEDESQ